MSIEPTQRTRVRRSERASFERSLIYEVLDGAPICHLGFVHDGSPAVVPTIHARVGGALYLHGSRGTRAMRLPKQGAEVCVEVTLLDGLVLARSAFHHSMNYRSVMLFGRAAEVIDRDEMWEASKAVVEHVCPGRWDHIRRPTAKELIKTQFLRIPISEASAKFREGPPVDDDEDYDLEVWAGVVPVRMVYDAAVPDPRLAPGVAVPAHVEGLRRDIVP
ncbi:MAG TPA: pyridoxamine 5'-phosphate oxidase family protein [Actinomycetota bacterium]|jgi:nitroimidazol reductase NimA-like FMN-containing flavoprotein (pyridoxamine 5'-phosphate oxidase superfamily)|nr:pyridoxamine 5'-phosphate oxidase family protein [Actinomycetota bacterium]